VVEAMDAKANTHTKKKKLMVKYKACIREQARASKKGYRRRGVFLKQVFLNSLIRVK
jgi:hypothetical protein